MKEKNLLTILITTYNRAPILNALLKLLSNYQQKGLPFNVIVSDDNSNDDTETICNDWNNVIKDYKYIRTKENRGMDYNFRNAYEACETDFCWLLGDTRYVEFYELKKIIDILNERKYDALILKCHKNVNVSTKEYADINTLMQELGWQITNNASCIIPKQFINRFLYNRYMGTTFLHLGIFVENLCLKNGIKVLYIADVFVKNLELGSFKKIGWTHHPFLNFGKLWCEFILSLPNQINIETKLQVLQDHNKYTELFSIKKIPGMKVLYGNEFIENYKKYRKYVPYISKTHIWIYDFIILYMPTSILKLILLIFKNIRDSRKALKE